MAPTIEFAMPSTLPWLPEEKADSTLCTQHVKSRKHNPVQPQVIC